jgi:hypothetical protein
MNHERSGSRTERNWSARTSFKTCFTPQGQRISTAAFSAAPSPKCTRLSLAHKQLPAEVATRVCPFTAGLIVSSLVVSYGNDVKKPAGALEMAIRFEVSVPIRKNRVKFQRVRP